MYPDFWGVRFLLDDFLKHFLMMIFLFAKRLLSLIGNFIFHEGEDDVFGLGFVDKLALRCYMNLDIFPDFSLN